MRTLLFVLLGIFIATPSFAAAIHEFDRYCEECHFGAPGEGDVELSVTLNEVCTSCHDMQAESSHPLLVISGTAQIPPDFPVSKYGEVLCVSCHAVCQTPGEDNPNMLRGDRRGERFCANCHQTEADPWAGRHYGVGGIAHLRKKENGSSLGEEGMDEVSPACIGCHLEGVDAQYSHPVGVDFEEAGRQNQALRKPDSLPDYIFLSGGKVSCISCHNIYSENESLLVVENGGSKLCLSCHDL